MKILFLFLLCLNFISLAQADVQQLSEQEFRALSTDLAAKVNLFQDVWEKDPEAVFYGGTSRDYLYWLKGKFLNVHSREQALEMAASLRKLPLIDVRDFIIGESDVDIVSGKGIQLNPADYGVRKVDTIGAEVFDPATELGKNELWQGHIPVEKIQITNHGIQQVPELGDGLHEIYSSMLTVHFSDPKKFADTKFAKEGINHPVLLALRYLRLQGINYFRTHGDGYPDPKKLMEAFDPASLTETKKVIDGVLDGKELKAFLQQHKFKSWLNGTIQKSFRSYTNPTAALEILKKFSVDQLAAIYGEENIEPIYQYVFAKHRDPAAIEAKLNKFHVKKETFFEDPAKVFPDGFLYHGTKTEEGFRSIVFQGVLPSEGGTGGKGLYGVPSTNRDFAESWGGSPDRLVKLPVKPGAKIVNIEGGEGKRVLKASGLNEEQFAEAFGVDIVRYPYNTEAYVVKNSGALGPAQGVNRRLMSFNEFLEQAQKFSSPEDLVKGIGFNQLSTRETDILLDHSKFSDDKILPLFLKKLNDAVPAARLVEQIAWGASVSPDGDAAYKALAEANRLVELFHRTNFWRRNSQALGPALLKTGNNLAVALASYGDEKLPLDDKFMALLKGGAATWNAKYDGKRALVEFLYRQPKFAHLSEALGLITKPGVGLEMVMRLMADHRLPPRESAKLLKDYIPMEKYVEQNRKYPLANESPYQILLRQVPEDMMAPVKKILKDQWENNGEDFLGNIFQGSVTDAELLDAYLGGGPVRDIFNEGFFKHPSWMSEEVRIGKFLKLELAPQGAHLNLGAGWSKDLETLREISAVYHGNKRSVPVLLLTYLMENNLWEKDPALTAKLAFAVDHHDLTVRLLKDPHVGKYPEIMRALAKKYALSWLGFPATLPYITPGWAADPAILDIVTKDGVVNEFIAEALLSHAVAANNPNGLVRYAAYVHLGSHPEEAMAGLKRLLALPHWQNHPAFQDLRVKGKISYEKFWQKSLEKYPQNKRLLKTISVNCSSFFSRFRGK